MDELAREACRRWRAWMGADGMFPDPEFEEFMDTMERLEDAVSPAATDDCVIVDTRGPAQSGMEAIVEAWDEAGV